MGFMEWAKAELDRIPKDEDGIQEMMNKNILKILEVFSEQGHSGFSASYAIYMQYRLLKGKPITPLTGAEEEWAEPYSAKGSRQNKRCSSVFLNADGTACDIDGIIVSDNGGITWFSSGSFRKEVTFPYLPPTEPEKVYIEYTEEVPGDKYEIITGDEKRIKALHDRKRAEFDAME